LRQYFQHLFSKHILQTYSQFLTNFFDLTNQIETL
jgi:ABC-type transporter MlaC component